MTIHSTRTASNIVPQPQTALPAAEQSDRSESNSILDKVALGAKVAGVSLLPGIGGYFGMRGIGFQLGLNGDSAYKVVDAGTLANYASVPFLMAAPIFPSVGLTGAGICLSAAALSSLYGAAKLGAFDS